VSWGRSPEANYAVDIEVQAYDRSGLLRDITIILANERINVIAVHTQSDKYENIATMKITVEVPNLERLGKMLAQIKQLPNVIEARRRKSD
jgi:GTP pyrophosphokinase